MGHFRRRLLVLIAHCGICLHAVIAAVRLKLPYDALADFAPVSLVGSSPLLLMANPKSPVNTLPEVRERMAKMGVEIEAGTPEEFDKFFRAEFAKWSGVAKQAGVKGIYSAGQLPRKCSFRANRR